MRLIDADALFRKVKTECNPYGKPTIGFEDGKRVMSWIEHAPTICGWISTKDNLPPDGQHCAVHYAGVTESGERCYTQDVADYFMGRWWFAWSNCNGLKPDVVAWYPLPQPPEEENE